MKDADQITAFGKSIDQKLTAVKQYLPEDLIIAHTSDQPLQVKENISLFMDSLYEAIVLVVLVSWLGFWEWRSALLMALAIPITLAMTFGSMYLLESTYSRSLWPPSSLHLGFWSMIPYSPVIP